jgi:hypothetical protein
MKRHLCANCGSRRNEDKMYLLIIPAIRNKFWVCHAHFRHQQSHVFISAKKRFEMSSTDDNLDRSTIFVKLIDAFADE